MILKIVIMHISKAQILVLEYHSHEKEPLFLKEMASEGLRRKIIKWIWIILWQKGYVSRIHLKREIFNQIRGSSTKFGTILASERMMIKDYTIIDRIILCTIVILKGVEELERKNILIEKCHLII